ncbi:MULTISPECIES: hypothetical protein [Paenibacillus]|uniref:hypothetical protein n=1 Tax=Paenibacillus TaxID=44249 RepID=UPI0022B89BFA|nr:hypothetical protein [Paenibacillus caseinilyticus]MCZ8521948.1 hypothetical protein [Paenibacillus caseinilyticus]
MKLSERMTTVTDDALQSGRDQIEIRFELREGARMEAALLAELLTAVQHTVYTLDARWLPDLKKVPAVVSGENALCAVQIHGSPYGIRLESRHEADLFGVTPATRAVQALAELVRDSPQEALLQSSLKRFSPRAAAAYQRLLELMLRAKASVLLVHGAPNGGHTSARLTAAELERACLLIQQTNESTSTLTSQGILAAVNVKRGTFQLEGEDGTPYSGKLSTEIKQSLSKGNKIEVPMKADVLMEVTTTFNISTGSRTAAYKLLQFYPRSGSLEDAQQAKLKDTLSRLQRMYNKVERMIYREGSFASQESYEGGASPLSQADYMELRGVVGQLDEEDTEEQTLAVDAADLTVLKDLLEPGQPISQLAESSGAAAAGLAADDLYGEEAYLDPGAHAALAKAAEQHKKRSLEAYPDMRMLLERLGNVIGALERVL